jgi:hypothetical protein
MANHKIDWPETPPFLPHLAEADVVEWTLLLPGKQAAAVEALAHRFGMTTGNLLRLMIADWVNQQSHLHAHRD